MCFSMLRGNVKMCIFPSQTETNKTARLKELEKPI